MALFKARHVKKILAGEKTQTRRRHGNGWKIGRIYGIRDRWYAHAKAHILITRKFKQRLGDISVADIKKEGYRNIWEFKAAWIRINGKWDPNEVVTAYEFKVLESGERQVKVNFSKGKIVTCDKCGHSWISRTVTSDLPKRCPKCHSRNW